MILKATRIDNAVTENSFARGCASYKHILYIILYLLINLKKASYRQVKSTLYNMFSLKIYTIFSAFVPRYMFYRMCSASYRQVASKLNHAHIGIYFIYRGAVVGSNGFMIFNAIDVFLKHTPVKAYLLIELCVSRFPSRMPVLLFCCPFSLLS